MEVEIEILEEEMLVAETSEMEVEIEILEEKMLVAET